MATTSPFAYSAYEFWNEFLSTKHFKFYSVCGDAAFPVKQKELEMRLQGRPALLEGYTQGKKGVYLTKLTLIIPAPCND